MAGIMHMDRAKGQRRLLNQPYLSSWRDRGEQWSLPAIGRPPTDERYYDEYAFDATPRAYSPSANRRTAVGWRKRYPRRVAGPTDDDAKATLRRQLMEEAERKRQADEQAREQRKQDAILWNREKSTADRERLIGRFGTYRAGNTANQMPPYSVNMPARHSGFRGGQKCSKQTYNTAEFSFAETGSRRERFDEPPVAKYSIARRVDAGEHIFGYTGHVMGIQNLPGRTFGRATRECVHGFEPSPYQ